MTLCTSLEDKFPAAPLYVQQIVLAELLQSSSGLRTEDAQRVAKHSAQAASNMNAAELEPSTGVNYADTWPLSYVHPSQGSGHSHVKP